MRFSVFVTLSIVASSVSSLAIPSVSNVEHRDYASLQMRSPSFFHTGHSSSSSSSSSSDASSIHSESHHGSHPPSPGRSPSPHPSEHSDSSDLSISDDHHITFSESGLRHLDGLGTLTDAERKQVEKEHKIRIKEHMEEIGASHAEIHFMGHAQGSVDTRPHITATFKKLVTGPHGRQHYVPIPSSWIDANGVIQHGRQHRHHVYLNKHDPHNAVDYLREHMPVYRSKLQIKQGLGPNDEPTLRRRGAGTHHHPLN
ncbi:hypothetical protein CVT24_008903 [Panaeolus cyanescens]|uniref:Uncharacterized protein n=1 Tax=Panaeolus cyanescens TaxID=181874 RepID=A0A409WEI3_9AGAR|nr:hypothetical protein CVT24_008903 [Panaeolus cyanescens]